MITIKDIAQRLELSASTVGRALADHPRISRETKDRVRAVADELGYIGNTAARVMRGGSSHLVGLLVPDIQSTFYSMVAQVLSKCLEAEGFHLALSITDDNRDIEMKQLRELFGARVAGVVIVPTASPRQESMELLRSVLHVQLLRRIPALGDWFGMDDERSILDATNHLIALGHRRISYIGDLLFPTGKARYEGFRRALNEAKLPFDSALTELGEPTSQFGSEAVARLLGRRVPPTAIVTSTVLTTLGAAEQLSALGLKVPGQVSIVGFGDGSWQRWWGPGMTTLRLPTEELAAGTGLWFLHRLKTARAGAPPGEVHISVSPTTLVIRGSTAAASKR